MAKGTEGVDVGTVRIGVSWLAATLIAAASAAAGGGVTSLLYTDAKERAASLEVEKEGLRKSNETLIDQLRKSASPDDLRQCTAKLEELRSNRNGAVQDELLSLEAQHNRDTSTLYELQAKISQSYGRGLSAADQVIYATAQQRWEKYPAEREILLKQLVRAP